MSSMDSKVYLVSGANRGIGLALVTQLASRPNTIIFAGTRDPTNASELQALAATASGKVHIIKLVSASEENNKLAIKEIEAKVGHIDTIIANAGIWMHSGTMQTSPLQDFSKCFDVNVLGPIALYQAAYSLLKKSKNPQFFVIGSMVGSLEDMIGSMPNGPYASSKLASNFVTRKIHFEEESITACSYHPGMVGSDMGNAAIADMGFTPKEAVEAFKIEILTLDQSAAHLLAQFDEATRETVGGRFFDYSGKTLKW